MVSRNGVDLIPLICEDEFNVECLRIKHEEKITIAKDKSKHVPYRGFAECQEALFHCTAKILLDFTVK